MTDKAHQDAKHPNTSTRTGSGNETVKHAEQDRVAGKTAGKPDVAPPPTSGLDTLGNFRFGAKYSVAVRGGGLVITEANSGREQEVSEATFEGLIKETYFSN